MLKVGLIGTGIIANEHAKAIQLLPGTAALVAAADIAPERLQSFCSLFHVSRAYQDAADLIADPEIDLVAITTPPASHEPLVVGALERGKYVFCEKPLAHSLASAARIAAAEARHPGQLAVSYQMRYDASFHRLRWLCRNGWVGDIKSALIERHGVIPHSDDGRNGWWGTWNVAGGGVLLTQLIHELDLLTLMMGHPTSVEAVMDTRYTGIESEDYVEATFKFAHGRTAHCRASVNSGYLGGGFVIQGSEGAVSLSGHFITKDQSKLAKALREVDRALPETCPPSQSIVSRGARLLARRVGAREKPELTPHAFLYREIARNIKFKTPLPISSTEAISSLELCMAAYESAITGKEIHLPLGSTSAVYDGVLKENYNARKCSLNKTTSIEAAHASLMAMNAARHDKSPVGPVERFAVGLTRQVLSMARVEPGLVKAVLRVPPHVHGGPRARRWPWPRRRLFDSRERRAVLRVLDREIRNGGAIVYEGPEEKAYCEAFARYLGGGFADAVNSGTNALYVALRALNPEPGSEVVVPPVTDAGGTMPVAMMNCIPIPVDSEVGSVLTSADQIRPVLTERTAAIVVAHIGGYPVDMDPILKLAAEYQIPVVEDCAQAHGAMYKGRMVGSLGTISAFSTMFGKHHATGAQGGVVFTKDPLLIGRVRQVADRGKPSGMRGGGNLFASLNFNQDEISMAIGRVQLEKLPGAVKARRTFASLIETGLIGVDGVALVSDPQGCLSSYLFLMLRLDVAKLRCTSQDFATGLLKEGINDVYAGYPVYPTDQPWHRDAAVFGTSSMPWSLNTGQTRPQRYELPNSRQANRSIVRIDIHESLGVREARDLVAAIKKVALYYKSPDEELPTMTHNPTRING
jgi:dTDP-4-amino-4,6-dideoxygalactose transaminase/predicted dehydrogenase